ncbi:F-box protein CPR1-like [Silene latifolia]|uniref:F-box protein CPR1-like n=1 Tax=Silene latifolia TaxID=37657 RepID=UPI003D77CA9F
MKWAIAYLSSYGFGYDSEHDDYKIVWTRNCWRVDDRDRHVFIYSLKSDLWSSLTPLTRVSTERRCWTKIESVALLVNDMLHYLVYLMTEGSINEYKIARFDVISEKWRDDLSLPVQVNNDVHLGKLDGWLYIHVDNLGIYSSDIWKMEKDGSWKKFFHLPKDIQGRCRIIAHSECHSLLLQDCRFDRTELFWYDQRDKKRIPFKPEPLQRHCRSFILCIASLDTIPGPP